MTHDWLLVETLGSEPAVVAQGPRTKNLVPISAFLRRNPHLMAIQSAIGETVRAGVGLSSITPKNDRVIRTEIVKMSDGLIHGVHLWIGPPDLEAPARPIHRPAAERPPEKPPEAPVERSTRPTRQAPAAGMGRQIQFARSRDIRPQIHNETASFQNERKLLRG